MSATDIEGIKKKFALVKGFDALWALLQQELNRFQIKHVTYGCCFSTMVMNQKKSNLHYQYETEKSGGGAYAQGFPGFIKTSHDSGYLDCLSRGYNLSDDYMAMHCMTSSDPIFRHRTQAWLHKANERQRIFFDAIQSLGLGVGVTIPLRFDRYGLSVLGLTYQGSADAFEAMWSTHEQTIFNIIQLFDQATRQHSDNSYYQLSDDQIQLLQWMQVHGRASLAADEVYGDAITSQAKHKRIKKLKEMLHVTQDVHLVLKAQAFRLI